MALKLDGIPVHASITTERVIAAVERHNNSLDNPGLCVSCGADQDGCEPDARGLDCESCEGPFVYGADELLLMIA